MHARYGFLVAWLLLGCVLGSARSADEKGIEPTSQIRIRSLDDALADLKLVANLVGQEAFATDLEGRLKQLLPKGFEGIDSKKPIFFYAGISPIGQAPFGVALVPISNEAIFIQMVEHLAQVKATKEGSFHLFSVPNFPLPIYVRIKEGYACISPFKFTLEDGKLIVPAKFLVTPVTASVSIQVRFDRFSGFLKQPIRSQCEALAKEQKSQRIAGEAATSRAVRLALVEGAVQFLTLVIEDGEELNLELDPGKSREKANAKLSIRAKPNTLLARHITKIGSSESLFAGWAMSPNPVVQFAFHGRLPEQGRKIFDAIMHDSIDQPLGENVAGKVHEAMKATVDAGDLDVALSWRGPNARGLYAYLAGFKILEADKLEQLVKANPKMFGEAINFDVAGSGPYQIHSLQPATAAQDPEAKLFAGGKVHFAFRKDALLLVYGDGLPELKEALLAKPQKGRALEGEIKLGKALQSFAGSFRKLEDILKEKFQKPGADSARLTLEGGGELRLNIEFGIPLLEYMIKDAQAVAVACGSGKGSFWAKLCRRSRQGSAIPRRILGTRNRKLSWIDANANEPPDSRDL